jgi:hypothetical protein
MPAGHVKTISEVTGSLPASGSAAPVWTGQRTDTRFYVADAGPDKVGPGGWQANVLTITATPAQACSVLVEGGWISDREPPSYIADVAGWVPPSMSYDPWVWVPVGTVSFSAGVLKSQTISIAPYRWVRVSLANSAVAQGPVTITEDFTDQ